MRAHEIKKKTTECYTPQPNVEATNNELRDLLRALFIKSGTLHWKSHLEDLMRSTNSNRYLVTGETSHDVLVEHLQSLYIKDEGKKLGGLNDYVRRMSVTKSTPNGSRVD